MSKHTKDDAKTRKDPYPGRKPKGSLLNRLGGVRHTGGVILIQALVRNMGTCSLDEKGEIQAEDPRG